MAKLHWADHTASEMLRDAPAQQTFVLAAGITPSGQVHVGNFREVITVDLVARALKALGQDVRFLFSWDDFDVFRKVPKDLPDADAFEQQLRRSVSDVPDPWGESDSYAGHFVDAFQSELASVGIAPEFIRQSARYKAGVYADGIQRAIDARGVIADILNSHRTAPLTDDWLPLAGFCSKCGRDELTMTLGDPGQVRYECRTCGHGEQVKLCDGGGLKLPWRIDWPMRWAYEQVDFEPGGKDHTTVGGSFDTGREIAEKVFGRKAPRYLGYEFVKAKGQGGKLSSSSGGVITVSDCLQIYQPEILRWLFAKSSPRATLQISFDDDVIQTYEEFDRAVTAARQVPAGEDSNRGVARRAIELSSVAADRNLLTSSFVPPPFRQITTVLQAFAGDLGRTLTYFSNHVNDDAERSWLTARIDCAWNWIRLYAPEDFRFLIRTEPVVRTLNAEQRDGLGRLTRAMRDGAQTETDLIATLKEVSKLPNVDTKTFFPVAYDLLIGKDKGPKLSTLLASVGPERALELFEPSLAAS